MFEQILKYQSIIILSFLVIYSLVFNFKENNKFRFFVTLYGCLLASFSGFIFFFFPQSAVEGGFYFDSLAGFGIIVNCLFLFISILSNFPNLRKEGIEADLVDIDTLFILATIGSIILVSANNIFVMFLGFELMSLSIYTLVCSPRKEKASSEGALKYFIMGSFASAFMLFGLVLLYGLLGRSDLSVMPQLSLTNIIHIVPLVLILFGFIFKLSLVPLHFWSPDAYQGAPSSVAGFMSAIVKISAFIVLFRFINKISYNELLANLIWCLIVGTVTFANITALAQKSVKRLLAYSGIANAGLAVSGFVFLQQKGFSHGIFFLFIYVVSSLGAFLVYKSISENINSAYDRDDIRNLEGFVQRNRYLALSFSVFLFSMAGMPPLAGFFGKFFILSGVASSGLYALLTILIFNSILSFCYYTYLVGRIYFIDPLKISVPPFVISLNQKMAIGICLIIVVFGGICSSYFLILTDYFLKI